MALASPFFGLLLGLEPKALAATTATLIVGTPALTLIGAIGAALMAALGRGGLLIAVLVLPFTIPVLIFGVSAAASVSLPPAPFYGPVPDSGGADAGQFGDRSGGGRRRAQVRARLAPF